jgi:hypothetical protein
MNTSGAGAGRSTAPTMRPWDMLVADAEALLGFYTRAHVRERMCDCWACVAQTWPDRFGAALRAAAARIEALPSWAALAWKECALAAASRRELELPMVASSVDSALESIVYRLSAGSSRWGAPLSEYRYTDAIDRAFGYKCVVMCETAVRRVLDLFPNNPRQFPSRCRKIHLRGSLAACARPDSRCRRRRRQPPRV